ncbi:MAG: AAA family ATPase [Candidatus Krumholzibacteria bacterium]|nr:AAA family ATPase [Candidatus Krumholzibacteria bacterium]
MYEAFYGLQENPFGTTPDPRYLYRSRAHREALAYLGYGVFRKKGFLAVTGEVGIGKTTVVRAFVQTFQPCLDVAFVLNTRVDFQELLYMLLTDFGVEIRNDSKVAMLAELNGFLIGRFGANQNPVLIIDEAQNLSVEVLEELRMLSNLETDEQKLIQIVLVGQPELGNVLGRDDMRQLRQRIPGVFHMQYLSDEDVAHYVAFRLGVAAGDGTHGVTFADGSLASISHLSGGIPRLINLICDRVLMRGYLARAHRIDGKLVDASVRELSDYLVGDGNARRTGTAGGVA